MADDLKKTGRPDDIRINVDQEHEVAYWARAFGVTAAQLRAAVDKVGPMVKNVKRFLAK